MPHTRFTGDEIANRGEDIYDRVLRAQVETQQNVGKIISIDIETGDYEIDADPVVAGRRLQARHPDVAMYGKRIGYDAVYAVGGTVLRTTD
jgi:hypothetical protein